MGHRKGRRPQTRQVIETSSLSNVKLHIRDENGEYLPGVNVAIYLLSDRTTLFNEINQDGKININLPITNNTEIEIRCRKIIPGKERYINFSAAYTIFSPQFELKIIMEKDIYYNPA